MDQEEKAVDYKQYHMPAELVDELIEHYGLDQED
jgi:hypothetical protein